MQTNVYVVLKKCNHYNSFQSSIDPPPVLTWNAGYTQIEGVFTYYPHKYALKIGFEIHGPFPLDNIPTCDLFDTKQSQQSTQSISSNVTLNYPFQQEESPSFEFDKSQIKINSNHPPLNYPSFNPSNISGNILESDPFQQKELSSYDFNTLDLIKTKQNLNYPKSFFDLSNSDNN